LADAMPVSGRDFLAAYVAGFETETRIARAVNFHHYDKGWHPTVCCCNRRSRSHGRRCHSPAPRP
jgi:2-methylcitrate dehydratase PrpD